MTEIEVQYKKYKLHVLGYLFALDGCCGICVFHDVDLNYWKTTNNSYEDDDTITAQEVPLTIKKILYKMLIKNLKNSVKELGEGYGRVIFTDALEPYTKTHHPTLLGMGKMLKLNGHDYYTINKRQPHKGNKNYLFSVEIP